MSVLDGLYIYQDQGVCLLTYSIDGTSQNNAKFNQYIPTSAADSSSVIELGPLQLLYVKKYGHLILFVPFGTSSPPLTIEQVVSQFILVAESYLSSRLTPKTVAENKATLILILSEMLASGIPRITEPNIIRQLLPQDNFLTSLIGTGALGGSNGSNNGHSAINAAATGRTSLISSGLNNRQIPDELVPWELPWRSAKVKHSRDELYIDVIESIKQVLYRSHSSRSRRRDKIRLEVFGKVRLFSRLSGTPVVNLNLGDIPPDFVNATGLHDSVDSSKFLGSGGKTLTFVPPDGESVLAMYSTTQFERQFVLESELRRDINGSGDGVFELRISTAINLKIKEISGLMAHIIFPPGVKYVKEISSTSGDFITSNPQACELRFSEPVPTGWNASVKAVGYDSANNPVEPTYVAMHYSILGMIPSCFNIKSVHITQDKLKPTDPAPYKGIRYQTEVDSYIWS